MHSEIDFYILLHCCQKIMLVSLFNKKYTTLAENQPFINDISVDKEQGKGIRCIFQFKYQHLIDIGTS